MSMVKTHNKSSEPTRDSFAALRGEHLGRAARLKRYVSQNVLGNDQDTAI